MVNLLYMRTSRLFYIKKKAFCPISSEPILSHEVILTQEGLCIFSAAELDEMSVGLLQFDEVCMNGSLAPIIPSSPLDLVSHRKLQLVHSIPLSRWLMKILSLTETGRMISATQELAEKSNLYFLLNFICKMVNIKFQSYGEKKPLMLTSPIWEDS